MFEITPHIVLLFFFLQVGCTLWLSMQKVWLDKLQMLIHQQLIQDTTSLKGKLSGLAYPLIIFFYQYCTIQYLEAFNFITWLWSVFNILSVIYITGNVDKITIKWNNQQGMISFSLLGIAIVLSLL